MAKVLILGGYGTFGKRIASALAKKGVGVIVAGRHRDKAEALAREIGAEAAVFDAADLAAQLMQLRPAVVINTVGPFQTATYACANACIAARVHYIDLADGRDYVARFSGLDAAARASGVTAITGASTVPGLSSAVIEHFAPEFSHIDSLVYGISPGQKTERGLATTEAIMTYVGKRLKPFAGSNAPVYGWQNLYRQTYPELGRRWMANCDIPDLDLVPARYGIDSIRFSAGLEVGALHLGVWLLSWLVRAGLPLDLPGRAAFLLRASNAFDALGSADGGMHMVLHGRDRAGNTRQQSWFLIAKNGDGPQVPCVPAILLTQKLLSGAGPKTGAHPCVELIALQDYMAELKDFHVHEFAAVTPAA